MLPEPEGSEHQLSEITIPIKLKLPAASMWLAKYQDVGKVSKWLGDSPGILLTRYYELVGPEDAVKFWSADDSEFSSDPPAVPA